MNIKLKNKADKLFNDMKNMSQDELYKLLIDSGADGLIKVDNKKDAGVFCIDNDNSNNNIKIKSINKNKDKTFINFNKVDINSNKTKYFF